MPKSAAVQAELELHTWGLGLSIDYSQYNQYPLAKKGLSLGLLGTSKRSIWNNSGYKNKTFLKVYSEYFLYLCQPFGKWDPSKEHLSNKVI